MTVYPHTVKIFVDILSDFWVKLEYMLLPCFRCLRPIVLTLLECLLCSLIKHLTSNYMQLLPSWKNMHSCFHITATEDKSLIE